MIFHPELYQRKKYQQDAQKHYLYEYDRQEISLFHKILPFLTHQPVNLTDVFELQVVMEEGGFVMDRRDVKEVITDKLLSRFRRYQFNGGMKEFIRRHFYI